MRLGYYPLHNQFLPFQRGIGRPHLSDELHIRSFSSAISYRFMECYTKFKYNRIDYVGFGAMLIERELREKLRR